MTTHSALSEALQMSQPLNYYKANLRDLQFLLWEQFHLEDLLGKEPYANWGKEEVDTVLAELYDWCQKVLGPFNGTGDAVGCKLEDGKVKTPAGFKEAWKSLFEAGWRSLAVPEKFGGQGGPFTLHALAEEMMCGANTSFNMYPALTQGVADVVMHFGTPKQQEMWCPKLLDGTSGGTMCLTEPQ